MSRPRLRNLQRRSQANWVWIKDILIEFKERFFFGYARSSFLNFFAKNKSVKTILLVVLTKNSMLFIKIERKQKFYDNILS